MTQAIDASGGRGHRLPGGLSLLAALICLSLPAPAAALTGPADSGSSSTGATSSATGGTTAGVSTGGSSATDSARGGEAEASATAAVDAPSASTETTASTRSGSTGTSADSASVESSTSVSPDPRGSYSSAGGSTASPSESKPETETTSSSSSGLADASTPSTSTPSSAGAPSAKAETTSSTDQSQSSARVETAGGEETVKANTPAGATAAEMQLLSADASVSVGDLEAHAEVQRGPSASPTSLPTPLGTISLVVPRLNFEGGIWSPIGDVTVDLPDAGLDISSPLSGIADVDLSGRSGGASPSVSPPAAPSPTSGSSVSGGLPRSGEIALTAISGSTQSGLSGSPPQGQGASDLFAPRGPADPARAGPTASLRPDLSSWPSATAGSTPLLSAPIAESHAPASGAPGSASSSAASGSVVGLLATLALALLLAARRLELADSMRRPLLFVSLLARPG